MASKNIYIGDSNGVARETKKILLGDENGIAIPVKKLIYGDDNGIARLVYGEDNPYPIPLTETEIEALKGAYNITKQSLQEISYTEYSSWGLDIKALYENLNYAFPIRNGVYASWIATANSTAKYLINPNNWTVSLYVNDVDASSTGYWSKQVYGNVSLVPAVNQSRRDYDYVYIITGYNQLDAYRQGSFRQWTDAAACFNMSLSQKNRNLLGCLMCMWGSKGIPIYYGTDISTAVLLPDPSTL